jgi:hypothetical protein
MAMVARGDPMTRARRERGREEPRDWGAEAAAAARHVYDELFEAPRGAILWGQGVVAIFGNDGYSDDETRREVENLRRKLTAAGVEELGFGKDSALDPYSWALLVGAPGPEFHLVTSAGQRVRRSLLQGQFSEMVWDAWRETIPPERRALAGAFEQRQRGIRDRVTSDAEEE